MSKLLVSDELWAVVEPLLPPEPPKPTGGRPRVPNRAALSGIIFVLKTGIGWEWLPQEMGWIAEANWLPRSRKSGPSSRSALSKCRSERALSS